MVIVNISIRHSPASVTIRNTVPASVSSPSISSAPANTVATGMQVTNAITVTTVESIRRLSTGSVSLNTQLAIGSTGIISATRTPHTSQKTKPSGTANHA